MAEVTLGLSFDVVCDENSPGEEPASAFVRFETRPDADRRLLIRNCENKVEEDIKISEDESDFNSLHRQS